MILFQYTAEGTVAVSAGRISDDFLSFINNHQIQTAIPIKLSVAECSDQMTRMITTHPSRIAGTSP